MKRNISQQEQERIRRIELVKQMIKQNKMWHLKGRKADSTRIWGYLYSELEKGLETKFLNRFPIFMIEVNIHNNTFLVRTCKSYGTAFKTIRVKDSDYKKIIKEVNSALIHYHLAIIETSDSMRQTKHATRRQYTVEFVESDVNCQEK